MRLFLPTLLFAVLPALASAEDASLETVWIEPSQGQRDSASGIEVVTVNTHPDTGVESALIKVPKRALADNALEEVRVVGQAPQKAELPDLFPDLETEWVDDYDNDHYGLLVRFNDRQKTPFRLFVSSKDGFLDGAVEP